MCVQYCDWRESQDPEAVEREFAAILAPEVAPAAKVKKAKKTEEEDEEFTTVGKGGKSIQYTPETIFKNLQAIQEARGKKVSNGAHLESRLVLRRPIEHRSHGANPHS